MPRLVLVLLPVVAVLTGCTYSVHPLITERDLIKDVDLSGQWELEWPTPPTAGVQPFQSEAKKHRIPLRLQKYDESTYDVDLGDEYVETSGRDDWPDGWTLQIGKIGDQTYGQLIPRDLPSDPLLFSGIPVYYLLKLDLSDKDSEVRFSAMLDDDTAVIAKKEKLPHITYEPSGFVELTVFTGSSSDLQTMVSSRGKQLFSPLPIKLYRCRSEPK